MIICCDESMNVSTHIGPTKTLADCRCEGSVRSGVDPEAALRLMLAGFLSGILNDQNLMREALVTFGIRRFAGLRPPRGPACPQFPATFLIGISAKAFAG